MYKVSRWNNSNYNSSFINIFKRPTAKSISKKFNNFKYSEYIDNNVKSSYDAQFAQKYLDENKNFNSIFKEIVNKSFWRHILIFIICLALIAIIIACAIVFNIRLLLIAILVPIIIGLLASSPNSKRTIIKMKKDNGTDFFQNIIIFNDLYEQKNIINFSNETGPIEFRIALLMKNRTSFYIKPNEFKNIDYQKNSDQLFTIYLVTNFLLYFFTNTTKNKQN